MSALLGRVSSLQVIVPCDSDNVALHFDGRSVMRYRLCDARMMWVLCAVNACCEHFGHVCIKLFGSTFLFDRRVLTHAFDVFPGGKDAPFEYIFGEKCFSLNTHPQHYHGAVHRFHEQASIRNTKRRGRGGRG